MTKARNLIDSGKPANIITATLAASSTIKKNNGGIFLAVTFEYKKSLFTALFNYHETRLHLMIVMPQISQALSPHLQKNKNKNKMKMELRELLPMNLNSIYIIASNLELFTTFHEWHTFQPSSYSSWEQAATL